MPALSGLPFGRVKFDPDRRGEEGEEDAMTPTNGERAHTGQLMLALSCCCDMPIQKARLRLEQFADLVNLTEAPEEALTDLLTNLMHYCHREGIRWTGSDGVATWALVHFSAESGGAAI
jgi:hypothetical protein